MTIKAPRASSIPDLYYGKYVSSLFSEGEQGVWYDPSDLGTLFQDAAGTTPVTGVEQPVGLILDKSKNGVGRNGTKRVNLLRNTERFSDSSWLKQNSVVTENATNAPNGEATADLYVVNASSSAINNDLYQQFTGLVPNLRYVYRVCVKSAGRRYLQVILNANSFVSNAYVNVDLVTGEFTLIGAGISDYSIVPVENGFFEVKISGNSKPTVTTQFIEHVIIPSPTSILYAPSTSNGTDGIYIWGADLRLASEANTQPLYQRVDADWPSTIPGNHATQTTTASRPVLSARVNLLVRSEEFGSSSWSKGYVTVTENAVLAPDQTFADAIIETVTSGIHEIWQPAVPLLAGTKYRASFWLKRKGRNRVRIEFDATRFGTSKRAIFNLETGTVSSFSTEAASILGAGDGWYICSVEQTCTSSGTSAPFYTTLLLDGSDAVLYAGDGTSGVYGWRADLRVANESQLIPSYQRVNTATDYDTQGFPLYLRFDGVDDWLVTPSINFTSTDKMTVFAGIRKLSDAASGIAAELSSNVGGNSQSFALFAPGNNGANHLRWVPEGGRDINSPNQYPAPISAVLAGVGKKAGIGEFIVNGVSVGAGAVQTAGNYGNYPLYIGRRGGTTLPFNGRLYGLVVRGAQTDDLHLTNVERYLASKSGIVL